ncbi:glutathione S-transferase [Halenospora varia]|nr:glutathione S-transferase [Halenospora varia]
MSKPITVYGHAMGPNPWKVVMIMEELGIPYEQKFLEFSDMQQPWFRKINVNGRTPAIEDPNTGVTLWESGAIIEYLVETYDKQRIMSFDTCPEKYQLIQWIHFQMSGQGPYFGQSAWFNHFHPEKIASAQDRYKDQIKRVYRVLDTHLQGKQYLVGEKCTVADIAFITWFTMVPWIFGDEMESLEIAKNYPNYHSWLERLMERPAVKKTLKDHADAKGRH